MATSGASAAGSGGSSKSSFAARRPATDQDHDQGDNLLDRRSSLEYGIFGVLFTLSKEKSEHRIRHRWVLLKILLDGWQLFTTVISPARHNWSIDPSGTAWTIVGVLNFTWLGDLGYDVYLAVLYSVLALLTINIGMCVWVAWCFKEHKFPVVWPIKVLRVFSSVFFQAFDVASLNLLQLGIACRFTGPDKPRLHFDLFPKYSCTTSPHIMHAVVSALCLVLFVAIALLLNMAEVEINPLSRRPMALGHSGAEVTAFAIKVLLTLVNVFIGWSRVEASVYLALSLALAWQTVRWNAHLVSWVNYLKAGVSGSVVWCSVALMLLVFHPGVNQADVDAWSELMTVLLLAGLAPAFGLGALVSWASLRHMSTSALRGLENPKKLPTSDAFSLVDEPRDVEIASRCCRVWKEPVTLDPEAVNKAHQIIKAGLEMFPNSAFMVLLHANFMIDVLGVSQSGSRRIEDARKLNPSLMCRFVMFVRQQQATQNAAGNSVNSSASMDLLGYVEYQRKQRMVVRLHREALQAMCNFWKALDASSVSFTYLSKALGKIETSVSQAQRAYRVVLESYGNNPKLVHLYGKFLQTIKNDPWHAAEYFAEAERLEELHDSNASGPLMPDGTPLSRMDEIDTAVLVLNAVGEVQMANKHTQILFGYKRGVLEGKPLATLLAPHFARRLSERLLGIAATSDMPGSTAAAEAINAADEMVVGLHCDRLAFPAKLSLSKASGVGEDSTIIALIEPVPPVPGVSSVWVTHNGIITACDPSFVANFGWRATEVNGTSVKGIITCAPPPKPAPITTAAAAAVIGGSNGDQDPAAAKATATAAAPRGVARHNESASDMIKRLLLQAAASSEPQFLAEAGAPDQQQPAGVDCMVPHKYMRKAIACTLSIIQNTTMDAPVVHELRIRTEAEPVQLLAINRKGAILHASAELATRLKDRSGLGGMGMLEPHAGTMLNPGGGGGADGGGGEGLPGMGGTAENTAAHTTLLNGFTLFDFLSPAWKEMHFKLLKDITTVSPLPVAELSCRKSDGLFGPTLELRTAGGRVLYMRVAVSTNEIQGEIVHIVHLQRSSLETALAERRLRLSLSPEGLISAVQSGNSMQLFGLDVNKVVGRGLWEVVEETLAAAPAPPGKAAHDATPGSRTLASLISRALRQPGHSWRVQVVPALSRAARVSFTSLSKPAIMQVHVMMPADDDEAGVPSVHVDLWPLTTVVGVLELDQFGRIRTVLEEPTRPAGLLFGVPSQSLVGSMLGEVVALPPGRTKPADLLSMHGTKKSSLKTQSQTKETSVKVGPVHALQAAHLDGRPLSLDVQVVGKPGPHESVTAIIKFHVAPMMPRLLVAPPQPPPPPPQPPLTTLAPCAVIITPASGRSAPPPRGTASTAVARVGSVRVEESPAGNLVFIDAPAAKLAPEEAAAAMLTPQRTPSLEDSKRRLSSPWLATVPQQPPVIRALSTPPTAKAQSGLPPPASMTALDYKLLDAQDPEPPIDAPSDSAEQQQRTLTISPAGTMDGTPGSVKGGSAAGTQAHTAQLLGRSKLGGLVKTMSETAAGGDRGSIASRPTPRVDGDVGLDGKLGGGGARMGTPVADDGGGGATGGRGDLSVKSGASFRVPGAVRPSDFLDHEDEEDGYGGDGGGALSDAGGGSDSDRHGAGPAKSQGSHGRAQKAGRVLDWVASKGAFYQNSAVKDIAKVPERFVASREGYEPDDEGDADLVYGADGVPYPPEVQRGGPEVGSGKGSGIPGPGMEGLASSAYEGEDDAGSDGGQSAVSGAQSATGSEYTRGKRFRKLAKLMDSSQTQQVQKRLRIHSLVVVGLLALVHIICFVLTVTTIKQQQTSMTQLGRSGKAQLYMHRIMIDVRILDIMSRDKLVSNLFTPDEAPKYTARIASDAEEVKTRMNDILNANAKSPNIIKLLYQTKRTVWDTNDADGSDIFTNLTIWDFATRFYSMAKQVTQLHPQWVIDKEFVADTYPGQFLLKSGPDLFIDSRKLLDALLFNAVASARRVDILQIVFLVVEGAAISFIAACYLMFLLRAVAAQRFKLYSTFLIIPVGLTRALASQNTNLLIDEDDEDDGEEEDERAAQAVIQEAEREADAVTPKRRRATLKVVSDDPQGLPTIAASGGAPAAGGWRRGGNPDAGSPVHKPPYPPPCRTLTADSADGGLATGWAGWRSRLRNILGRRSAILPLTSGGSIVGANSILAAALGNSKRSLKFDSHETIFMLLPFIVWSILVIAIYATAVIQMQGVDEVVAVHSVVNFMSARTSRTVFFGQELSNTYDPDKLMARRAALIRTVKLVKDAWYTLQLGDQAYTAVGDATERFPLVKTGLSHASKKLTDLFYTSGTCHRLEENGPCPGSDYRFYQVTHTGLDTMMQQLMISLSSMGSNTSLVPEGLEDEHWDFVFNVGYKDLLDGTVRIAEAHLDTILKLFSGILILHIILFLTFWVIFASFLWFMLNPLLKRVSQERRRIAELMSQLPLELDVEKLVAKALGTGGPAGGPNGATGGDGDRSVLAGGGAGGASAVGGGEVNNDGTSKWKAIIRASSSLTGKGPSLDGRKR